MIDVSPSLSGALQERMRDALARTSATLLDHVADARLPASGSRGLGGNSGYALAFTALFEASGDERYAAAAAATLRAAASDQDRPGLGLFGGLSGLRAAAAYAARTWPACARLVDQCDRRLAADIDRTVLPEAIEMGTYDLISGFAGAIVARGFLEPRDPDRLVDLALAVFDSEPRWATRNPFLPERGFRHEIGIAHGLSGVLAAIALSTPPVQACVGAVTRLANLVADAAVEGAAGPGWPQHLHDDAIYEPSLAWCYGGVGIAAGLHAVALWAGDERLRALCLRALDAMHASSALGNAALCHGSMGAAVAFAGVSAAEGGRYDAAVARFVEESLDRLQRDGWVVPVRVEGMEPYDSYSELDGLAGIALALATMLFPIDASWMRLHAFQALR